MTMPDGTRHELFGYGGGQAVADALTQTVGANVPLLGQIPLDITLREGGDRGYPVVMSNPDAPAGKELGRIAKELAGRARGLAGRKLGVSINTR